MLHQWLRHRPPRRLVADSGKEIEDFKLSFGFCGCTVHGQLLLTSRSIDPRRVTPLVVETRFWRPIKSPLNEHLAAVKRLGKPRRRITFHTAQSQHGPECVRREPAMIRLAHEAAHEQVNLA